MVEATVDTAMTEDVVASASDAAAPVPSAGRSPATVTTPLKAVRMRPVEATQSTELPQQIALAEPESAAVKESSIVGAILQGEVAFADIPRSDGMWKALLKSKRNLAQANKSHRRLGCYGLLGRRDNTDLGFGYDVTRGPRQKSPKIHGRLAGNRPVAQEHPSPSSLPAALKATGGVSGAPLLLSASASDSGEVVVSSQHMAESFVSKAASAKFSASAAAAATLLKVNPAENKLPEMSDNLPTSVDQRPMTVPRRYLPYEPPEEDCGVGGAYGRARRGEEWRLAREHFSEFWTAPPSDAKFRNAWRTGNQERRWLLFARDDLVSANAPDAFADRARGGVLHGDGGPGATGGLIRPPPPPETRCWHEIPRRTTKKLVLEEEWRSLEGSAGKSAKRPTALALDLSIASNDACKQ